MTIKSKNSTPLSWEELDSESRISDATSCKCLPRNFITKNWEKQWKWKELKILKMDKWKMSSAESVGEVKMTQKTLLLLHAHVKDLLDSFISNA